MQELLSALSLPGAVGPCGARRKLREQKGGLFLVTVTGLDLFLGLRIGMSSGFDMVWVWAPPPLLLCCSVTASTGYWCTTPPLALGLAFVLAPLLWLRLLLLLLLLLPLVFLLLLLLLHL